MVVENGQAGFYLHVDDGLAIADHYDGIADSIIRWQVFMATARSCWSFIAVASRQLRLSTPRMAYA